MKNRRVQKSKVSEMHCCVMMILFNLFLANFLQISNNFCKFLQSRAMQFSSLPSKVERMKECLRKHMENTETERFFFLDYAGDYLP